MKNMKKKVLATLLVGAMAASLLAGCGTTVETTGSSEKTESALLMENIEALAGGESHVPMHCVGFGTVDCPINHEKVKIVATGYSLEDLY